MGTRLTIEEISDRFNNLNCKLVTDEYLSSSQKLKFICNKHADKGIQETALRNLGRGQCCHYCGKERSLSSRRVSDAELQEITEKAGFIYCGIAYVNNKTNIKYKCNKHFENGIQIASTANIRKSKGNCPYCLNKKRTHDDFVKEINLLNPNIEILNEFKSTDSIVRCKCKNDGNEWTTHARNLLQGQNCKLCMNKIIGRSQMHSDEWFKDKMLELHPDIEILTPYAGIKVNVECRCKIDGTLWKTTPDSLINGKHGCRKCFRIRTGNRCRKQESEFLDQLKYVNPNIMALENYVDDHTKIKCKCLIHDYIWNAMPNKIIHRMTGCPKCASYHNENKIDKILSKWGYTYTIQKRFNDCKDKKALPFDRYLDDFNILIEYDGEGHFDPIRRNGMSETRANEVLNKTKFHDKIKDEYCMKNNIPLIRIPYWESDNMEVFLFDKLLELNAIETIKNVV